MIGHRRREFENAWNKLQVLRERPSDLGVLLDLQRSLFKRISYLEQRTALRKRDLKDATSRLKNGMLTKPEATAFRRRIANIRICLDAYGFLIFVWKCIGDGIAFVYIDKHSLKQSCYDVASTSPKQTAGFLSGKMGVKGEIALMEALIEAGCPCLLSDLTNSIRYGDVCLMMGNDPHFIEVKSAERSNKRGKRQIAAIKKLHSFLATDSAENFRGFDRLKRVEPATKEVSYPHIMNKAIEVAKSDGVAIESPEPGLYYVAAYDNFDPESVLRPLCLQSSCVFLLNEFKTAKMWAPYEPFMLTINNKEHIYDFVVGRLVILVIWDLQPSRAEVKAQGGELSFAADGSGTLKFRPSRCREEGAVGEHMVRRIGLDFTSPRWIINHLEELMRQTANALER